VVWKITDEQFMVPVRVECQLVGYFGRRQLHNPQIGRATTSIVSGRADKFGANLGTPAKPAL